MLLQKKQAFSPVRRYQRLAALLLCLLTAGMLLCPVSASAQEPEHKIVRVGWFESSFCYRDQFGRRCGIDYEYQQKISAYTGWTYEYVEDSWPNLLQKLKDGEIDLLSDVSYQPEREEFMSFPDLPMGTESYYIYIDAENRDITADSVSSFDGKRIGVNQGSVQEGFLRDWAEKNHVSLEVVPLTTDEDESMDMVTRGEIDGYASIYSFSSEQKVVPVCRVGSSEYFYAVNKKRPDLLFGLNMALAGIQDEDPYFNQRLSEERLYNTRTNAFLTPNQEDWLAEHGTIRVGYRENYLPFCQTDPETGELTGALKDYLAHAANNLRSSDVSFEPVPYHTTEAALEAMKAGEVDCVFPVNLSSYDSDEMGIRLTNPAMKTETVAVMRASGHQSLSRDSAVTFALHEGSQNIKTFIMEEYPASSWKIFKDELECYEAVASGNADCVLVSNYRIPAFEGIMESHKLFSVPTGESMPFSFAVNQSNRELYFLLNKTVLMTRSEDMDSALASYTRTSQELTLTQFLKDNWLIVVAVISAVFTVIIVLLIQKMRAERRASEQQRQLEEAAEVAKLKQTISSLLDNMPGMTFTKDAETGAYLACNQAFAEYAKKKRPEEVIGFSAGQLFDAELAKRFEEDDKMALSMDVPYVYFEDLPDEVGGRRHIKTTKLKYTDAAGRQCVLGMSTDVTMDTFHIHRADASTKEAYEKVRSTGMIYSHLAQALAQGYSELFYVDLNTEGFIEYRTDESAGSLTETRRGWHFFEKCREDAMRLIYPEDLDGVIEALDRKHLVAALNKSNTFMLTYRLIGDGDPTYVSMRVTRMQDDERFVVLGVTDIDEQMKQRHTAARMKEEQAAYNRLSALAGSYLSVYLVDPDTGSYREFSATAGFKRFDLPREGLDFFTESRQNVSGVLCSEDQEHFLAVFTRENVLDEVERHGIFTVSYRLMMDEEPRYVQLKVVMVEEEKGPCLVVGVNDIDTQVRQEEDYELRLARAHKAAHVDALTGVKNKYAYQDAEARLNLRIQTQTNPEFAVVILDVNNLKKVNDTQGHKAGDQLIRDACSTICTIFSHSPVFRIGGDEFAVISQGADYVRIDRLVQEVTDHNTEALDSGGAVIACGMAKYEGESAVAQVFERADQRMYENKSELKNRQAAQKL